MDGCAHFVKVSVSVAHSLGEMLALPGLGGVVLGTVTPRCSPLLYSLTSGVILWPFIYFRGLVLLSFLISGRHQLENLWPQSDGGIRLCPNESITHYTELVLLAH